jgi:type II secretory pathway pseudopilin PulG
MGLGVRGGATLVEVLLVVTVLAVATAGIAGLVAGILRGEAEARRRMEARNAVLGALEAGRAGRPAPGCRVERRGGRLEARRPWRDGDPAAEVVLGVWCGHE